MLGRLLQKLIVIFFVLIATKLESQSNHLSIGAAASLQDVLKEAGDTWLKNEGALANLSYSFAGTSTLTRQVKLGAPLDILVSAAKSHVDEILEGQLGIRNSLKTLASNRLVLITASENKLKLASLDQIAKDTEIKIATCDEAVPIGFYAQNYLRALGLYEQIKPRFIYTDNARSILRMVANQTTRYGFVYLTDAISDSKRVKVVKQASPGDHPPIEYQSIILTRTNQETRRLAKAFLDFLSSPKGQAIFNKHGFKDAGPKIATQ